MPKFVIERTLPGAGKLSTAQVHVISQKPCGVLRNMARRSSGSIPTSPRTRSTASISPPTKPPSASTPSAAASRQTPSPASPASSTRPPPS